MMDICSMFHMGFHLANPKIMKLICTLSVMSRIHWWHAPGLMQGFFFWFELCPKNYVRFLWSLQIMSDFSKLCPKNSGIRMRPLEVPSSVEGWYTVDSFHISSMRKCLCHSIEPPPAVGKRINLLIRLRGRKRLKTYWFPNGLPGPGTELWRFELFSIYIYNHSLRYWSRNCSQF